MITAHKPKASKAGKNVYHRRETGARTYHIAHPTKLEYTICNTRRATLVVSMDAWKNVDPRARCPLCCQAVNVAKVKSIDFEFEPVGGVVRKTPHRSS